ncbi:hypothetical protein ACLMJK_006796 [Lecanora helva]
MDHQELPNQDKTIPDQGHQFPHEQYQNASQTQVLSPSAATRTTKTYNMYYTTSRLNVRLHLGSPCVYYCQGTILTNKPQLQLRSGDSKSAPMVAFAKLHLTSRNLLIGSGDYQRDSEDKLVWEEIRREKLRLVRSDYEFDTAIGSGTRRTYSWKRDMESAMKTVYRCVDETGQVVISLLSGGMFNWKKGGEIEIVQGLDKSLEELLIVSALGIWAAEAGWSVFKGYPSGKDKDGPRH